MGLFIHFYIIFGTNLLTGGPAQIAVFLPISVFRRKRYQTESKRNETFGNMIFGTNVIHRTWSLRKVINQESTRQGGAPTPPWARPPPSSAPRGSTGLLLPPIYTYIPPNHRGAPQKPNSTAATFCTREIPSWGLFRCSAGGGIDHGGLLQQHRSLSNDV